MKYLSIAALALCSALALPAAAQKIITFESKPMKTGKSAHDYGGDNSLTLGLGSFLNGYTALYYERRVTQFMTLMAGGGFTYRSYMNDFGMLVWNDGENSDYPYNYDIKDNYASYKYRKSSPGLYAAFSPHFYFRDNPLDGFYLAPMLEVKQYRYSARLADVTVPADNSYYGQDDDDVRRASATYAEHMNCLDVTFNSGGHYELRNHMALGWNIGIGFRTISAERLDIGTVADGAGGLRYENNMHSYSATRPLVLFNFVMGGWF